MLRIFYVYFLQLNHFYIDDPGFIKQVHNIINRYFVYFNVMNRLKKFN